MNSEEFEKLCDELRAQYAVVAKKEHPDASEDEIEDMCNAAIMSELWDMFKDDKISKDELIKMAGQLGFEPSGDLAEDPDTVTSVEDKDGEEVVLTPEAIEEAQSYDDNNNEGKDESDEDSDKNEDEDEENDRKEARKLFGFED